MPNPFNITKNGTWPNENYSISLDPLVVDPNIGPFSVQNFFRYLESPLNETTSLSNFSYNNCSTQTTDGGVYKIQTTPTTNFTWNVNTERTTSDTGYTINSFYIDSTPLASIFETNAAPEGKVYYSYLILPQRLALIPMGKPVYNTSTGSWTLSTQVQLLRENTFYFTATGGPEAQAANTVRDFYKKVTPIFDPFVFSGTQTLTYKMSACRTKIETPIVSFTNTNNPYYASVILEPYNKGYSIIRPYSTFLSYEVSYYVFDGVQNNLATLGQLRPDTFTHTNETFTSSYILVQDTSSNTQTFQLVQIRTDNSDTYLSNSQYCVLSAVASLSGTIVKYYSNYFKAGDLTFVNNLTGLPNTSINFSYIADCPAFKNSKETWQSTFKGLSSGDASLGNPTSNSAATTAVWTTKYPPHYYGYKATVADSSTGAKETANLTFKLVSSAISTSYTSIGSVSSIVLYNFLASDFNQIVYDYSLPNMPRDFIKFTPLISDKTILYCLSCCYGNNFEKTYDLTNPAWIPAVSAVNFLITYPIARHGEINFLLRPSLSSATAGDFIDAYESVKINMAAGQMTYNFGQPIFITKTREYADYMEIDSSFLNSVSAWPSRDLTDSYISWSVYPRPSGVNLYSVDLSGNFIKYITPNASYPWNDQTWSIIAEGYKATPTTVTLSSQRYSEIATLSSVPSLFDVFAENAVSVIPTEPLNNYNKIRTIKFKARVPYKNTFLDLPANTIISWTWAYDGSDYYNIIPVSAFKAYTLNERDVPYFYGKSGPAYQLSAIEIRVDPEYADTNPDIHNVSVIATVDTTKGALKGIYTFQVDDFPSPNILNTNFSIYYTQFQDASALIMDTMMGDDNIVTRPNLFYNDYTLIPNNLSRKYTYAWTISAQNNNLTTALKTSNAEYYYYRAKFYDVNTAYITLSALSAIPAGWTSAHNVETTVTFNILSASDFFTPLQIISYPEYFWEGRGAQLTISSPSNYTLSLAPTAYQNKRSNSQTFWISANKSFFDDYEYLIGDKAQISTSTDSNLVLVDIPYNSEFLSISGISISLSAFDMQYYPKQNGITYIAPVSTTKGQYISQFPFNITANTLSFNYPLPQGQSIFTRPPRAVPYETPSFYFKPKTNRLVLENNTIISVTQTVTAYKTNSPTRVIGGEVIYFLTTDYWTVSASAPVTDGVVSLDLFNLSVGDPAVPLNVSGTDNNTFILSASANVLAQIPPSTFGHYNNNQYTGNRDLWNPVNYTLTSPSFTINANLTSAIPNVYISNYYTITGENIWVQYKSPYISTSKSIVAYVTDFGEESGDAIRISAFDDAVFYQYNIPGTYYISYSAIYSDNTISPFINNVPVTVESKWNEYDPNNIRNVNEATLTLPYTSDQVSISPNEFGNEDIFNTSVLRLQDCIEYLHSNLITLNTNSPAVYYGWLGCNKKLVANGIQWYTKNFYSRYYLNPEYAVMMSPSSYFKALRDVKESSDHIFVLDGTQLRTFSAGAVPMEIMLDGIDSLSGFVLNPVSIEYDESLSSIFMVDAAANKVYRFDLDLYQDQPAINLSLDVGFFGYRNDPTKFHSPSDSSYANQKLFILDYNNQCIKQFNTDLSWTFTYYTDAFENDSPVKIAVHPKFNYLYVLGASNTVYVFEERASDPMSTFGLNQTEIVSDIMKIHFDESGDFLYVITSSKVLKYSSDGFYVTTLDLPSNIMFNGGASSHDRTLLFITDNCIVKVQDPLRLHSVGEGLALEYWSREQLMVGRDEFSSDLNYNRSLIRLAQNLKMFRSSLNGKLVLATEQTATNIIKYFAIIPISNSDLPTFDNNIELENIGVGVNELHVPQTINKELMKIYDGLSKLTSFLSVEDFNITGSNCLGFCWSWDGTSCYNLSLPAVRICSINPITYAELENSFVDTYAPSKNWGNAISDCCSKVIPPV